MKPLYCSFWTEGSGYEAEADGLVKTLDRFGLEHDVQGIPDRGSWAVNTQQKPPYLLRMREKYPGKPLVWLDADSRVLKSPVLFDDLRCDIAFNLFGGEQLATGTLYFGPGALATGLLVAWNEGCAWRPGVDDQKCLGSVIDHWRTPLDIVYLPPEYLAIFDASVCEESEIVIWHGQASRRLKHAL